jgi:hypothetical protein
MMTATGLAATAIVFCLCCATATAVRMATAIDDDCNRIGGDRVLPLLCHRHGAHGD